MSFEQDVNEIAKGIKRFKVVAVSSGDKSEIGSFITFDDAEEAAKDYIMDISGGRYDNVEEQLYVDANGRDVNVFKYKSDSVEIREI